MRLSSRPSSGLFSTSVLILAAACGDVPGPLISEQDAVGSKKAALSAKGASARRHPQSERAFRQHRDERLDALMADARKLRHRSTPNEEDLFLPPAEELPADE